MPTISKIRLTNILYEGGEKRFNDEVFTFDGENSAIVLENGGGKTVLIHTVLQAILPHTDLGDRKIKDTLRLENAPAHIGIEWMISEHPRRYLTTAVSLFQHNNRLTSYRYAFEYEENHAESLVRMPFVIQMENGNYRPAYKEEISEYYTTMKNKTYNASTFDTIGSFGTYLEEHYQIIHDEWKSIVKINRDEGGIAAFFDDCKTSADLFNRLLIPMVEDSIAGHEKNMFANMFEKQRESFHMYRSLQRSMQEHQAIQTELDTYVAKYKKFSEEIAAYEIEQRRAKGAKEILHDERRVNEQSEKDFEVDLEAWRRDEYILKKEQASYKIIQLQQEADRLKTAYEQQLATYEEAKEKLRDGEKTLASLLYAQHREAKDAFLQNRQFYEKELTKYDAAHDITDDEEALEIVQQKLHGYYVTALETIDQAISGKQSEKTPLEDTIDEVIEKLDRAKEESQESNEKIHYMSGQLESQQSQNEQLKQKLLANPEQENVRTFYQRWVERQQSLDESIISIEQEKKEIRNKVTSLTDEKEHVRHSIADIELHLNDLKRKEEQVNAQQSKLKEKLAELRPSWLAIDDLYLQEARIGATLQDMQEKMQREREDALYKERLASRFVDDYDTQFLFFADPFLAERLKEWQNQFFILTGLEYIENLQDTDRAPYNDYELWPLTLVTTATDKPKLKNKVKEVNKRLQYPVTILTLEEAKQLGNEEGEVTWIAPAHWKTNQTRESFEEWKRDIREEAKKITGERIIKDQEVSHTQDVMQHFQQFFTDYPKTDFDQLQLNRQASYKEKEKFTRTMEIVSAEINKQETAHETAEEKLEQHREEKHGLERKIELASNYLQGEKTIDSLQVSIQEKESLTAQLAKEISHLEKTLERYQTDIDDINAQIREHQEERRFIQADPLFKEVSSMPLKFTEEAKAALSEQKETLENRIRGIRQQYGELEVKYEQAIKDIMRMNEAMETVITDHGTVDTEMAFPIDGDKQIEQKKQTVQTIRLQVGELRDQVERAGRSETAADTRANTALENFETEFFDEELETFDFAMAEIPVYLTDKEQSLTRRKQYIDKTEQRIKKEQTDINNAIRELEKYEIAHSLNHPNITAIPLTEKEQTRIPYERITFIQERTKALEKQQANLNNARVSIEQARNDFRYFCTETISEPKLRKMAIDGIEMKTSYDDILAFRQNMTTTLERAQTHARDYISRNDKEVQAFINNIHNHLMNVTDQLKIIPQNTRVKVGDKWKAIYKFTIPEWKEEDGKSKLRDYMDWILKQLESDRFKNDEGEEDHLKVRKEVEKWLQTKQLLHIVMGHHHMKAACRKVTNDNQVTSRLTSWEESNVWSGGEKWSKNMTLFLGLLNFVAEKKQHITSNMQRHRAVILDNPFGKASSEHVLSPVFFIAEQLGFQIIALTAHADGKFLQDYFPVNFSCRLVEAIGSSAQIMTKEKNLEHVYFQDHEPEEIGRLEEREQMELF